MFRQRQVFHLLFASELVQRTLVMSLPSTNPLEGLPCPEEPSSEFHDKLSDILCGGEYQEWAQSVEGGELIGLINYLGRVRRSISFPAPD
jgi:hypothetical protein